MSGLAITRGISPALAECELTHLDRVAIDFARAVAQHELYEAALERHGWVVDRLAADPACPDCVFVEDCAVVLDEVAVITRPGAPSRRPEVVAIAERLARERTLVTVEAPANLDGGDVLRLGRRLLVGLSPRSASGVDRLRALVAPFGYQVDGVPLSGCLHLKTAVTEVADGVVLANPNWVDVATFAGFEVLTVDSAEPFAANVLRLGSVVLVPQAHPRTAQRLVDRGLEVELIEADELAKAEGGLTCCSLLVPTAR